MCKDKINKKFLSEKERERERDGDKKRKIKERERKLWKVSQIPFNNK